MKKLLLVTLFLMCFLQLVAYDFAAVNEDYETIYCNLISATECEVTYCDLYWNHGYKGIINIPSSVKYNGKKISVKSIGNFAFRNCPDLTSVTIPNSVTSIGGSAFDGCNSLTSITIPNSVTIIGGSAFEGCYSLTSITIPSSVTFIDSDTFYCCRGLTSITIPNSVTSIGNKAFYGCKGLKSITIPNSVTGIYWSAFSGCSGLTSITIPNSVTGIGKYAFELCKNLEEVYCYADKCPRMGDNVFRDSYIEYATLHVPASALEAYKAADQWKDFGTIVAIEETTAIPLVNSYDGNIIYNLNGVIQNGSSTGINIIKKDSGESQKVYIK